MSQNVQEEILTVTKVKRKRGEEEQTFLTRVAAEVEDLSDDDWDELSEVAQQWYNDSADALNAKDDLPAFSDYDTEKGEEKPSRRSSSKKEEKPAPEETSPDEKGKVIKVDDIKPGMEVSIEDKYDNTVVGSVSKISGSFVFLDVDGENKRIGLKRIVEVTLLSSDDVIEPDSEPEKTHDAKKDEKLKESAGASSRKSKAVDESAATDGNVVVDVNLVDLALSKAEAAVSALKLIRDQLS